MRAEEMVPDVLPDLRCRDVTANIKRVWSAQRQATTAEPPQPRLWRALLTLCSREVAVGALSSSLQGVLSTILRPIVLALLIRTIESQRADEATTQEAVLVVLFFAAISFLDNMTKVFAFQKVNVGAAARFTSATSSLVFHKMLSGKLNIGERGAAAAKEGGAAPRRAESIINLVGTDVIGIKEQGMVLGMLAWAVVGGIGGVIMIFFTIGAVPALVGLAVNTFFICVSGWLSKSLKNVEEKRTAASDSRMQSLGQLIEGIKAVKFYAWEEPSTEKVSQLRSAECEWISKYRRVQAITMQTGRASPPLAACAALVVYTLMYDTLTVADALVTITIFQALRPITIMLPMAFAAAKSFGVALGRVQGFLLEEDHPARGVVEPDEAAVDVSCAELTWTEGEEAEPELSGVTFQAQRGKVTAIVGAVGSGKSTIISAVVGDLVPISGTVRSAESIGYVQQKSFIISDTVENNILFGRELDQHRFDKVVAASEFAHDLTLLADGAQTMIGERGATLSGGQQQRLSIARALYGAPELLVLDDPLSAVDPAVGEAIFQQAVLDFAKEGGAVLMATNQMHLLERCDHIVVVADGRVESQGTYAEIQGNGSAMAALMCEKAEATVDEVVDEIEEKKQPAAAGEGKTGGSKDTPAKPPPGKAAEKTATGAVSGSVYVQYMRAMGWVKVAVYFIGVFLTYGAMAASDWFLTIWVKERNALQVGSDALAAEFEDDGLYRLIYAALSFAFLLLAVLSSLLLVRMGHAAGQTLHREVFEKVIGAPLSWHEENPSGRITSRFSAELLRVDIFINSFIDTNVGMIFQVIALLVVIMVAVPPMVPVIAVSSVLYFFQVKAVDRGLRDVKRATNSALSPVMSNLTETLNGRVVIRAMACEDYFVRRHNESVDLYTRMDYCSQSMVR